MKEEKISLLNFTCRIIKNEKEGIPVIFLHGYIFTSDVWNEINALKHLEKNNIPFIALDMPYGQKSICEPKSSDPEINVKIVEKIVKNRKPVIVGASIGGYIALKYSIKNPVLGLVLIAPVRSLEKEMIKHYPLNAKVLIIYGEEDKIVSLKEMEKLVSLLKAKFVIYKNSGHPAYLSQPEKFKNDLLNFYKDLTSESLKN